MDPARAEEQGRGRTGVAGGVAVAARSPVHERQSWIRLSKLQCLVEFDFFILHTTMRVSEL